MQMTILIQLNKLIYANNLFSAGLFIVVFLFIIFGRFFLLFILNKQKNKHLKLKDDNEKIIIEEPHLEPTELNLVNDDNLDEEEGD